MARKTIEEFFIKVNGDKWTVRLYPNSMWPKEWRDAVAMTQYLHRKHDLTISFKGPAISRDTVAHELMHAYLSYFDFSKTSYGKIEEKICEVMGKKYKTLYFLTERVYSILRRGRKYASKKKDQEEEPRTNFYLSFPKRD